MTALQTAAVRRELNKFIGNASKFIALDVGIELEADTPKLTTFASKNWVPQVGSAFEGLSGVRSLNSPIDTTLRDTGIDSLERYTISKGAIYITNNVPYIGLLNSGTSTKAPRNFVQKAIAKGIAKTLSRPNSDFTG